MPLQLPVRPQQLVRRQRRDRMEAIQEGMVVRSTLLLRLGQRAISQYAVDHF